MPDLTIFMAFLLALAFEFVNGWTDAPNSIATAVSTRALSPRVAVIMAASFNLLGALSGTAVAATIGKGIVKPEALDGLTVASALIGVVCWSTLAWFLGLPTSESHGLIAGLTGAGLASGGFSVLQAEGWAKVGIGLLLSTLSGFVLAFLIMGLLLNLTHKMRPARMRANFSKLQVCSVAFMAFSHGSNDGQKTMGVMTLLLFLSGGIKEFKVPLWVIFLSAATMAIATAFGGWKIVKTMGMKMTKLTPIHGFAAELASATTITVASQFGIPLSTTHTIGTAIMGVGSHRRFSAVRWGVARNVVLAWILTFPVCGLISYFITFLIKTLLR
jgi:PiT family inorganic phosphate transporter